MNSNDIETAVVFVTTLVLMLIHWLTGNQPMKHDEKTD